MLDFGTQNLERAEQCVGRGLALAPGYVLVGPLYVPKSGQTVQILLLGEDRHVVSFGHHECLNN